MAFDFISYICPSAHGSGDYTTVVSWETAIQNDLTSAELRAYEVASVSSSGSVTDGETAQGTSNNYGCTIEHLQNSAHSTRYVLVLHDAVGSWQQVPAHWLRFR